MTKVSVVMATRNGHRYLDTAISSILKQTFRDFELIICNDHSVDDTDKIIKKYMKIDSRIKLFENGFEPGLTNALNYGVKHSSGQYIARMDDDDISHKNRFEREIDFLENHPEVSIISSNVNFFDDGGIYGKTNKIYEPTKKDIWRGKIFTHPAVMFRKSDIEKVGLYTNSDDVIRIEDYDLWCKFYSRGFVGINLVEPLLDYREDSNSFKKRDMKRKLRLAKRMVKWRKELNIPLWYDVFVIYEIIKILVPQKVIQVYHRKHFRMK